MVSPGGEHLKTGRIVVAAQAICVQAQMGAIDTHILRLLAEERLRQIMGVFVNCVGLASYHGGACSNVGKASDRLCSNPVLTKTVPICQQWQRIFSGSRTTFIHAWIQQPYGYS